VSKANLGASAADGTARARRPRTRTLANRTGTTLSRATGFTAATAPFEVVPVEEPVDGVLSGARPLAKPDVFASTRSTRARSSGVVLAVGDLVSLAGSALAAILLRSSVAAPERLSDRIIFVVGFSFLGLGLFAGHGSYRASGRPVVAGGWNDLRIAIPGLALMGWLLVGLLTLFGSNRAGSIDDLTIGLAVLLGAAAVPTVRTVSRTVQCELHPARRVIVVGSGMMAGRVARSLGWDRSVSVVGFVDDDPTDRGAVLGGIADLPALCQRLEVDQVIVAFSRTHPADSLERLRCIQGCVDVAVVPRYFELVSPRTTMWQLSGIPLLDLAPQQLGPGAKAAKRAFDIVFSGLLLALLAPVVAAIAVAVKVSSEGPVLFRQERTGLRGRTFVMYKFRTMVQSSSEVPESLLVRNEMDGPLFKMREDPRVTALGRFLRRTSLDELPQLFNVLAGEMSLVGPRPFIPTESSKMMGHALRRFEVKPGLTGLWQVSGRSMLSYDEVITLDYLYVASWSFWWDLKILLSTPWKVLRGIGAF
jgi:exopolysaccharide biosynthesis polyprenyl glycosylphosphotransferase